MVRAWYMDNETTDQRLEHHRNPPKFIELDELHKKTGVEYFQASQSFKWSVNHSKRIRFIRIQTACQYADL